MTNKKSQLTIKMLRWFFIFIIVLVLAIIPFFLGVGETKLYGDNLVNPWLWTTAIFTLLIEFAILFFGIGPIVLQLFEIQKKEKVEKEDLGIFP